MKNNKLNIKVMVLPCGRLDSCDREIDLCIGYAKAIIEEFKNLHALVIGISRDKRYICSYICKSSEEKRAKAAVIKANFKEYGVTAIVWISEAWVKKAKIEDAAKLLLPVRDMPDKEEAVVVSYHDGVTTKMVMLPITREYGKVFLGKMEEYSTTVDNLWGDYFGGSNA